MGLAIYGQTTSSVRRHCTTIIPPVDKGVNIPDVAKCGTVFAPDIIPVREDSR